MEDSGESNDRTQEVDIETYDTSSPTVTRKMDSEGTEQPIRDIGVKFIQTAANITALNTNSVENISCRRTSEIAVTSNFESESDNKNTEDNAPDESPNWLTCVAELSFLVENLRLTSNLLEDVKGDNCSLIEVF